MSDKKQNQEKWRAETQREQRKARLAALKSKDGGKKPIKTTNRIAVLVTVLVLVVALLGIGTWWVFSLGIPHRAVTAMTIGSSRITAAEFSYFYRSQLSYFNIDPNTDSGKATLAQPFDEEFPTVAEYLRDQAARELQQLVLLGDEARKAGIVLDENDQDTINSYITQITASARNQGMTLDNFLTASYGVGMNEALMRGVLSRYLLANKYSTDLQATFNVSDEEIQSHYLENKDTYDVVTYRSFYMAATIQTGATDEERKAAMDQTKARASEMLAKITGEESFKALCIDYAADEEEELAYSETDKSLNADKYKSSISDEAHSAWLFDQARRPGDKTILESTSGYYVYYFVSRRIADFNHVSVRHILVMANKESATAEQITAARARAESILAEFKAGTASEDFFAELANQYSEDGGSNTTGGLYSGVSPSSNFVPEFLSWSIDPARKVGDTGIVQTDFGFHIMYFSGIDGVEWKINAESAIVNQRYTSFIDGLVEENPFEWDRFGARFVG